jgi:hypothetical protein
MNHFLSCRSRGEFCPLCYAGLRGRGAYKGHYGYRGRGSRVTEESRWMALQRRKLERENGTAVPSALPLTGYWSKVAELCEWLSSTSWEDGSARCTGTMMLMAEDGRWKAWLHDRDGSCSCFVSSESLEGAVAAAAKAVASAGGDWRPDKKTGRK